MDRFLAAGGFGEVWQATDLLLEREVAVKLLHPGFARHGEVLARFRGEARHAAALCHENIARIFDYGEPPDGESPYLVMELVRGPSLAQVLARGPLTPAQVAGLIAQAAAGLHAAHQIGLVHRDIKPGNLLICPDETVKITDFGISHAAGAVPLTCTGQLMGTPGYLAPERACGAQATPASDLYALGVVAWECLAGSAAFTGSPVEVAVAHRDRPLPPLPASVPFGLADLVAALTAKHPASRAGPAGDIARHAAMLRAQLLAGQLPAAAAGSTAGLAPAGLAPAGLVTAGLAPAGLAPAGLAPAGLAPAGLAPAGLAPAGLAPTAELDGLAELPTVLPEPRRWRHRVGMHRARRFAASADNFTPPRRRTAPRGQTA
jgi:serine/threonine protein kinase